MIATIHNEPKFSELFMSYLLTRNSRIEEDLIDQLFNSSEKRLARLLLLLANFGKEGRPEPIVGTFSQETLADDRYDSIARELFYEQISQIGFYRIQRKNPGSQFIVERCFVRQARDQNEGCGHSHLVSFIRMHAALSHSKGA
jgi:hypothetical protein